VRVRLLIWKEFLQLARDPILLRMLIIMPIAQLLLLGYVVSADIKDISMAVVDLDHSPVSRTLTQSFSASGFFEIKEQLATESDIQPLLDDGKALIAVVIAKGTGAEVDAGRVAPIAIVVDGSNAQVSTVASSYAAQIVQAYNAQLASSYGSVGGVPQIDAKVRVVANPTLATVNAMIPGLVSLIMMLSLMVVMSMAVVRERESGTLEQMFVTPILPGEYLAGKVVPYALIATAQALFIGVLGSWWFGVPFVGNALVLMVGLLLFLLVCIGLGLLISLISSNRQQAQQAVVFTLIPSIVLSGWVFPIDSMPPTLSWVSQLLPLTHMIEILRSTFMKATDFIDMAVPLLALTTFAVIFFTSAIFATHRRLREM
jgi:ABC-2 type transport system permease protein